jgi:hypothetical protein
VAGNEVITADVVSVKSAAVELLRAKLDDTGMSQWKLAGLERSHISEMLVGRLARFSLNRINRALVVFNAEIETSYQCKPTHWISAPHHVDSVQSVRLVLVTRSSADRRKLAFRFHVRRCHRAAPTIVSSIGVATSQHGGN